MNVKLLKECLAALVREAVNNRDPEYASVEAFAQFLADDEREEFSHEDLAALNFRTRMPIHTLRAELESYGLKLAARVVPKATRGFTTSSNDRWFGPGSLKTHGGAGIDTSTGRATVKGRTV